MSFSAIYRKLLPSRLTKSDHGDRLAAVWSALIDASVERVEQGFLQRFPSYAGDAALGLLGRDRLLLRGKGESVAGFARRLQAWRYPRGHRVRGIAFALLDQIAAYFGGVRCYTIDQRGNIHTRTAAGVESYAYSQAWDWDGAATLPNWARFWYVLTPNPELPAIVAWGTYVAGGLSSMTFGEAAADSLTWGQQGVTVGDANAIKSLLVSRHPWKPGGTRAIMGVVQLTNHTIDPAPAPDGTWDTYVGRAGGTPGDLDFRFWSIN